MVSSRSGRISGRRARRARTDRSRLRKSRQRPTVELGGSTRFSRGKFFVERLSSFSVENLFIDVGGRRRFHRHLQSGQFLFYERRSAMFVQHERITRLFFESVRSSEVRRHSSVVPSESRYLDEINRLNPLGMKGEMAEELASVIKDLWAAEHSYIYANRLRVNERRRRRRKLSSFFRI